MSLPIPLHSMPVSPTLSMPGGSPPTSSSYKASLFGLNFLAEPVPIRPKTRWELLCDRWDEMEGAFWATVPILVHLGAIGLLATTMFQNGSHYSFLTVKEVGGTGQIDYGVFAACVVATNTSLRICGTPSIPAQFMPSLIIVSPTIPKISLFQLPITSWQTPEIFLTSIIFLVLSFAFIFPPWFAVYFPKSRLLKGPIGGFVKDRARELYFIGGVLAFASFCLTLTIGIGYRELLSVVIKNYTSSSAFELRKLSGAAMDVGLVDSGVGGEYSIGAVQWIPRLGHAWDLLWLSCALSALVPIGVNVALHNGLDERAAGDYGGQLGW